MEREILFRLESEFYQTELKLYIIKVDVELVRFGILVNDEDMYMKLNINGCKSDLIE